MIFTGFMVLYSEAWASYPQQNIEYDVFNKGKKVGTQKVTISYLPSNLEKPSGGRIIEVFTDLNLESGRYEQRGTAHFSGSDIRFVSASSLNDSNKEFQGRLKSNGIWLIHDIGSDGTTIHEFSNLEMEMPSLVFYDPVLSQQLLEKKQSSIFFVEHGLLVSGMWREQGPEKQRVSGKRIEGLRYELDSENPYRGVWSDTGLLMSWEMSYNGFDLSGKIKELPDQPNFGQIESLKSFERNNHHRCK